MSSKGLDRIMDKSDNSNKVRPEDTDEIINKNLDDIQAMRAIREKFGDSKQSANVFEEYKERKRLISKKADKFKTLIFSKYGNLALPSLLEKAKKYKHKYEFTDAEYNAFLNLALNDATYRSSNLYNQPTTPMSKALGYSSDISFGSMKVAPNELDIVQDIMRTHVESSVLHDQVKMQSMTYTDCAPQALRGNYDKNRQNSFSFIHPVVAALFLPRINYLDEQMLLASISSIVSNRYNGTPIKTQPEYELYWSLITDPNEIVCVNAKESPLVDLRNRVKLQVELWKLVRELREGRYYSEESRNFLIALDTCRNTFFDAPDMINTRDEGTVLRKLFGAFSLRPTWVSISSISSGIMSGNYSINPLALNQVTTIPIVNLRLPFNFRNRNISVYLNEALEQPDWFIENKMIVPKVKSIIFSRDIIVFYANRRYQSLNFTNIAQPYNFSVLPATQNALENINDITVSYTENMVVGNDNFNLRSVVFVERIVGNNNVNLIVGSSAGIIVRRDMSIGRTQPTYLLYNPQQAIAEFDAGATFESNRPITEIPGAEPFNNANSPESFRTRASTRGTIYIYAKQNSQQALHTN